MICFLTSSDMIPDTETLNPANGFTDALYRCWPEDCRALFVCSDQEGHDMTDFFADSQRRGFEEAGLPFSSFTVLDSRNADGTAELVRDSDVIILAGGHVPTQNRFFLEIGLKEAMEDFDGIVIGISAGTMNSAEEVYAHPELDGEAVDSDYERFLPGLGLTRTMILPHYQMVKDDVLDGLRIYEDIAFPDSFGRRFYSLPDGSYLYIENGREELRGEVRLVEDGEMTLIAEDGDITALD